MFQEQHSMLPVGTHDELAREEFCAGLRRLFTTELWPGCRDVYHARMAGEFRQRHGRDPETTDEVVELMRETPYFRDVGLLGRTAQEMLWDVVGEGIERQLPALNAQAKPREGDLGTIDTGRPVEIPRYIDSVDIHLMPGNFHTELSGDDVFAGALYDRGVHVFAFGGLGPRNDAYGGAIAAFLKERFPDLKPRRILDIGCGIGNITLQLVDAYPDAEVHGIDIGAPMVRYAHGRAESLGHKAHFSQQNMVATDFPDGHFDLVVSMLVTHECPVPTLRAMFKECNRLLAPGGVMMHDGTFRKVERAPIDDMLMSWFGPNVNEPFAVGFKRLNFAEAFVQAGFAEEELFTGSRPAVYLKGNLPPINFVGAVK